MVRSIVPWSPTAQPFPESTKKTPGRALVLPMDCGLQVAPPSTVLRIFPAAPTTVAVLPSNEEIPNSESVEPLSRVAQESPKSVSVRRFRFYLPRSKCWHRTGEIPRNCGGRDLAEASRWLHHLWCGGYFAFRTSTGARIDSTTHGDPDVGINERDRAGTAPAARIAASSSPRRPSFERCPPVPAASHPLFASRKKIP